MIIKELTRVVTLMKTITINLKLRMRHEYSHWKYNSKDNVSKQLESDSNSSIPFINSFEA
jgi:hypothetical protein